MGMFSGRACRVVSFLRAIAAVAPLQAVASGGAAVEPGRFHDVRGQALPHERVRHEEELVGRVLGTDGNTLYVIDGRRVVAVESKQMSTARTGDVIVARGEHNGDVFRTGYVEVQN